MNFPHTASAYQPALGGNQDAFLVKINPNVSGTSSLLYATYLGGVSDEDGWDVAVDASGLAYITGSTQSQNFPTTSNAFQSTKPAYQAAFLTKVDTGTSRVASVPYSSFLGGSNNDIGYGVGVDATQRAWIVGQTSSRTFPTTSDAYRKSNTPTLDSDAFLSAIDTTQAGTASLSYSSYYGGSNDDAAYSVTLDTANNVYFVGTTTGDLLSKNLPTTPGALQTQFSGGSTDGFLAKFSATSSALVCTGSVAGPPSVSASGTAELVGDFIISCTGGNAGSQITTTFQAFLNTNVANSSNPQLRLDNGALGSFSGSRTGVNVVTFTNITFPAPGSGTRTLTITGIRADASLLGISSTLVPAQIVMVVQTSNLPITINNSQQTVASITSNPAVLSISSTHGGNFAQGQTNATYNVIVRNGASAGATSGPVNVTETIPVGLTLVSMAGAGWSCSGNSCTRSDALSGGASYAPITVTVNVGSSAPASVTNVVAVSGSGAFSSASDVTSITAAAPYPSVFVTSLYQDLLNRAPDPGGLAYYVGALNSGGLTRSQEAAQFFTSPEFSSAGLYIIKLYFAVLKRNPDFGGWKYYFDALNAGQAPINVLYSFLNSPEFAQLYGSVSDASFVTLAYQNVLGRQPDPSGYSYWFGLLSNGSVSRAFIMDQFVRSPEYDNTVRARAYANLLYMGFLRRAADPGGLAFWTNVLSDQANLPEAIRGFIESPEYLGRF